MIENGGRKKLYRRLRNKYRLVVMNEDTFEEKLSFRLSPLNVYTAISITTLLLIVIGGIMVAFTPLRQYIPGYTDDRLRQRAVVTALRYDSLERQVATYERYVTNLRRILEGKDHPGEDSVSTPAKAPDTDYNAIGIERSDAEAALIVEIESEDKYNLAFQDAVPKDRPGSDPLFYCPLKGLITSGFSNRDKHYGVDIVAGKNEAVKATLGGKVIMASWTIQTGYVIALQHKNNLVSFYKHNSVLLKKEGQYVLAGEAIAIVGDSGELTSGPHLHFELWHNGNAVDPQDYILF